jgi:hypothetical protein
MINAFSGVLMKKYFLLLFTFLSILIYLPIYSQNNNTQNENDFIIDPTNAKVGNIYVNFKISKLKYSNDVFKIVNVTLVGKIELAGEYKYLGSEALYPNTVIFKPNESFYSKYPTLLQSKNTDMWFILTFKSKNDIKCFGDPGNSGKTKIKITKFILYSGPTDTGNYAYVTSVIM